MLEYVLSLAVMLYGVAGALASLLQLRRIHERGSSLDVSLAYLSVYGGGYVLWLAYGIVIHSVPLIVADAVGATAMAVTICAAGRLRVGARCIFIHRRLHPRPPRSTESGLTRRRPGTTVDELVLEFSPAVARQVPGLDGDPDRADVAGPARARAKSRVR